MPRSVRAIFSITPLFLLHLSLRNVACRCDQPALGAGSEPLGNILTNPALWWSGRQLGVLDSYIRTCEAAAESPRELKRFRSRLSFKVVASPVSPICGKKLLRLLRKHASWSVALHSAALRAAKALDTVGSPFLYNYGPGIGLMDPLSLRNLWYCMDMLRHFGSMKGWRVAEIGGSFGGLAKLLLDVAEVASVTVFELPQVKKLQFAYLRALGTNMSRVASPGSNLASEKYDLVVSLFCLSELSTAAQEMYATQILLPSSHIYVTSNAPAGSDLFTAQGDNTGTTRVDGKSKRKTRSPFLKLLLQSSPDHNMLYRTDYLRASEVLISNSVL